MSHAERKRKQLRALELLLTMLVAMNKMEGQQTRYSYQGSYEHQKHRIVVDGLCRELGLDAAMVEDDLRQLVGKLMGEPTIMIPDREILLADDMWRPVTDRRTPRILPRSDWPSA